MSLLIRVVVKTITDFTGMVQFRAYRELGGMYWTFIMFLALLASYGSLFVYYADIGEEGESEATFKIEKRVAWTLVGAASGAWVVVFGVFLLLMKKEYRHTFFTTRTGKQWAIDFFVKGADDAAKKSVVENNDKMWWPIREDVKEWVQRGWWRWKEEEPEWFTEVWQSMVPEEWITDVKERARLDKVRKTRMKRHSFSGLGNGKGRVYAGGGEERKASERASE